MVACLPSAMNDVHHREGIPPTDDTKQVLDTAVARRCICGARLGASAGRNVAGGDIRGASRHARNVARGASSSKRAGGRILTAAGCAGHISKPTCPGSPLSARMIATPGRRHATTIPLGVLAFLFVGACTRELPPSQERPFVAAITNDPGHLNPAITTNGGVHTAAGLLYDGLLWYDDSLAPKPALATRWEVEDGGARYRFHLRQGVRWHDGRPFTAADVAYTYNEVLLKYHARTRASLGPALADVVAVDDST